MLETLNQNLPTVGESNCVAIDEGLSTLLNENDFFNLANVQIVLNLWGNVAQKQSGPRWDANGWSRAWKQDLLQLRRGDANPRACVANLWITSFSPSIARRFGKWASE